MSNINTGNYQDIGSVANNDRFDSNSLKHSEDSSEKKDKMNSLMSKPRKKKTKEKPKGKQHRKISEKKDSMFGMSGSKTKGKNKLQFRHKEKTNSKDPEQAQYKAANDNSVQANSNEAPTSSVSSNVKVSRANYTSSVAKAVKVIAKYASNVKASNGVVSAKLTSNVPKSLAGSNMQIHAEGNVYKIEISNFATKAQAADATQFMTSNFGPIEEAVLDTTSAAKVEIYVNGQKVQKGAESKHSQRQGDSKGQHKGGSREGSGKHRK